MNEEEKKVIQKLLQNQQKFIEEHMVPVTGSAILANAEKYGYFRPFTPVQYLNLIEEKKEDDKENNK